MGVTDSEDEADTAEDLQRIEAAAAAISQRLDASSDAQTPQDIEVTSFTNYSLLNWIAGHNSHISHLVDQHT